MRDEHRNVCGQIDEEAIELHAMGKLPENSVRQHLDECEFCRGRVVEHRSWIEDLKHGLLEFRRAEQSSEPRRGAGDAPRQDES
jgi:hypothetical protein